MLSQRFFKYVESKSGLIFDFGLFSFKRMNFFKTRQSDYPEYTSLKNWIGSPENTVLTSLICHHHSKSPTSPLFDAMTLRPSHATKIFTKIFLKKSLSIYKTVGKIVAVVKKSCGVYEQ